MTISLRDMQPADHAWLDGWAGTCAAAAGYPRIDPRVPAASLMAAIAGADLRAKVIVADAAGPAGIAVYRIGAHPTIEFVGVTPAHARRGYGHAGACLVEEVLRAAGARSVYAAATAAHGIAVYFWIRLGYRPLVQDEWPRRCDGVAWLRRDFDVDARSRGERERPISETAPGSRASRRR